MGHVLSDKALIYTTLLLSFFMIRRNLEVTRVEILSYEITYISAKTSSTRNFKYGLLQLTKAKKYKILSIFEIKCESS